MVVGFETIAQATAIAGYNIADGKWWQESARARIMTKLGIVGSANAGDTKVEIFFGDQKIGEWVNTLGGAPGATVGLSRDHFQDLAVGFVLGAGIPINIKVVTQPTTNAIQLGIELKELKKNREFNGNGYGEY